MLNLRSLRIPHKIRPFRSQRLNHLRTTVRTFCARKKKGLRVAFRAKLANHMSTSSEIEPTRSIDPHCITRAVHHSTGPDVYRHVLACSVHRIASNLGQRKREDTLSKAISSGYIDRGWPEV